MAGRRGQAGIDGRYLDIADRRQIVEQVVALEDEAEMLAPQCGQLIRVHLTGVLPVNQILPARSSVQAAEDVHQRGFARTGLTDDGDQFSGTTNHADLLIGVVMEAKGEARGSLATMR